VNLWDFVGQQQTGRRLRLRRVAGVEALAARAPSRSVRDRHGTYYRLARELDGAVLHMDARMAELHRWALEGLGDIDVRLATGTIEIARKPARAVIAAATYRAKLDGLRLDILLEPAEREYVMSWVGEGPRTRMLVLPLNRFRAAGGALRSR
jgi:hypothetical protein